MKSSFFLSVFLASLFVSAQDDGVYYSPKHDAAVAEEKKPDTPGREYYDNEIYSDYYDDDSYPKSQTRKDSNGNTYITNNYYGDYYESDYSARLKRFYSPYRGFSYYSPCYIGYYYDPCYYYTPGWNWSVSFGWGWGYSSIYGYYDPWYFNYHPWYSFYPWHGWHHRHGYWHGYYHGYWDGYYDGYYGYPGYSYGYYNYHYGPRYKSQGVTSYRNSYAEKRTSESQVTEQQSNAAGTFPAGENKDVLQPVKIDKNVHQPGKQAANNELKPADNAAPANKHPAIDKWTLKPAGGAAKPANHDMKKQDDIKATEKYEAKPGNPPHNSTNQEQMNPGSAVPRNEVPVKGGQPFPKMEETDSERRENATYERTYDRPQRKVFEREHRGEPKGALRSAKPYYEKKSDVPKGKPEHSEHAPGINIAPSHNASPASYDRDALFEQPARSRGSFERNETVTPADRTPGGGKQFGHSPRQGGKSGSFGPK